MSQETEVELTTVQPKYTRYRSVRRAAAEESAQKEQVAAFAAAREQKNDAPVRSMSRYRRPRAVSKVEQNAHPAATVPAVPAVPALPPSQLNQTVSRSATRRATEPTPGSQAPTSQLLPLRNISEGQWGPGRESEDQRNFAQTVEEKLAEQKRKDLERLEATLDAAVQGPSVPSVGSPVKEKFNLFSRKRSMHTKTSPPPVPTTTVPAPSVVPTAPAPSSSSIARSAGSNETPRISNEPPLPRPVGQGGTMIVPGNDAPISAVNAGERRVLVRHKQSSINLPITPNTTALDIFYSAANIMSHNIAPANTVLLESYTQLGLERRVRRYEHIRDIMNSWDRDTQNALVLQNSDAPKYDTDLEASSVPKEPPPDVTVYLYHSQKPGRWHKSHITLLSTGQIFMSKKQGAKASDKDIVNLCHLSDFDIYTPVPAQLRRLKAPKKHCYAVKSQQKTTMFLSTENFVHFFSSDDEMLANKWYGAVQRWRSWYLVHKMGEGGEPGKKAKKGKKTSRPTTAVPGARALDQSTGDDRPYLIGSFQPLFGSSTEVVAPAAPEADSYESEEESRPSQIPFHLRNGARLSSAPAPRDSKRHPPPVSYRLPPDAGEEFASSGLLGHTYSERLKAQREREAQMSNAPFTDGPSLLNSSSTQAHRRSLSVRSTLTSREGNQPKPLLDFTPQFKEAPQWDKSGKGRGVMAPEGVPLVQVATGREGPGGGIGTDVPNMTLFNRDAAGRPKTAAGPRRGGYAGGNGAGSIMNRGRASYD